MTRTMFIKAKKMVQRLVSDEVSSTVRSRIEQDLANICFDISEHNFLKPLTELNTNKNEYSIAYICAEGCCCPDFAVDLFFRLSECEDQWKQNNAIEALSAYPINGDRYGDVSQYLENYSKN